MVGSSVSCSCPDTPYYLCSREAPEERRGERERNVPRSFPPPVIDPRYFSPPRDSGGPMDIHCMFTDSLCRGPVVPQTGTEDREGVGWDRGVLDTLQSLESPPPRVGR